MKILVLMLFLSNIGLAQMASSSAGCGPGYDQSTCGNVGGSFSTSGQTSLSACNTSLSAGNYYLSQDVTATPYSTNTAAQSLCFGITTGTIINLNGHTITGGIYANSQAQDAEIYNGTIACDIGYGQTIASGKVSYACINLTSLGCPASLPLKLHHLTLAPTANNYFAIKVDYSVSGTCTPQPTAKVYNNTITAAANSTSVRTANLYLLGDASARMTWEVYNNRLTCQATSSSCQGIAFYGAAGASAHNNYINLVTNTLDPGTYPNNSGDRGILADGDEPANGNNGNVTGSDSAQIYANSIITNNGRGIRIRNSSNVHVYSNAISAVATDAVSFGNCFHIGDPDSYDDDLKHYVVELNTCELGPSVPAIRFLRGFSSTGDGVIQNNRYVCKSSGCSGAWLGGARQPTGTGYRSIVTMKNETVGSGVAQATTNYQATADNGRSAAQSGNASNDNVTLTYCNVGTTGLSGASPAGAISPTITQSCP